MEKKKIIDYLTEISLIMIAYPFFSIVLSFIIVSLTDFKLIDIVFYILFIGYFLFFASIISFKNKILKAS